jgi:hypothetical protein
MTVVMKEQLQYINQTSTFDAALLANVTDLSHNLTSLNDFSAYGKNCTCNIAEQHACCSLLAVHGTVQMHWESSIRTWHKHCESVSGVSHPMIGFACSALLINLVPACCNRLIVLLLLLLHCRQDQPVRLHERVQKCDLAVHEPVW